MAFLSDKDHRASTSKILSLYQDKIRFSFEETVSQNQNLTFREAVLYFDKERIPFDDSEKVTLKLINKDRKYTNLALLISDQCPHTIKIGVYQGEDRVFRDHVEITGSLLRQAEDAYAYIDRYNKTQTEFVGIKRIDRRDYPEVAIREALLNAVAHRDYSSKASTLIHIFNKRIEFSSVGGLANGRNLNDIFLSISDSRNPYLCSLFNRLKLIEAFGTGIAKIKHSYAFFDMPTDFAVSDNAFRITLFNVNEYFNKQKHESTGSAEQRNNLSTDTKKSVVLKLFENNKSIVRKDIESALNISQSAANALLRRMLSDGLIIKSGSGNAQCYVLNQMRTPTLPF